MEVEVFGWVVLNQSLNGACKIDTQQIGVPNFDNSIGSEENLTSTDQLELYSAFEKVADSKAAATQN